MEEEQDRELELPLTQVEYLKLRPFYYAACIGFKAFVFYNGEALGNFAFMTASLNTILPNSSGTSVIAVSIITPPVCAPPLRPEAIQHGILRPMPLLKTIRCKPAHAVPVLLHCALF